MKKKDFITLILSTIGGILFALGMCMALLPEWDTLTQGVLIGLVGLVVLGAMVLVRRRMDGKPMIVFSGRTIAISLLGVLGAMVLGVGMCLVLVWDQLVAGVGIGLVGIVLLLCLIPAVKGLE